MLGLTVLWDAHVTEAKEDRPEMQQHVLQGLSVAYVMKVIESHLSVEFSFITIM